MARDEEYWQRVTAHYRVSEEFNAIVDAAHSFGQVDIRLADLGADFVGLNLHKWLGAPIGAGAMFIKASRLDDVERMFADETAPANSIQSRVHTGTANFATLLTVPTALDFHAAVGPAHKAARLRYLRDRWVKPLREVDGVQILTSDEPGTVAAISSFRLHGDGTKEANERHVRELLDRHHLFTVRRDGPSKGDCVRVTPALTTRLPTWIAWRSQLRQWRAATWVAPVSSSTPTQSPCNRMRPPSDHSLYRTRPRRRSSLRSVKSVGRAGELRIRSAALSELVMGE